MPAQPAEDTRMFGDAKPAAQYVRMSTEHQRYSTRNQEAAIRSYADQHGFSIVRTYKDKGKSGLTISGRKALQQLISDVIEERADYETILVYDVSRWGRFQDADESAHYEFLCKQAGVTVRYCAEPFENDDSAYVDSGNKQCSSMNGIVEGRFAEWVSIEHLAADRPSDPSAGAKGTAAIVGGSDDYRHHRDAFVNAANGLIRQGECTIEHFKETGGWIKSTQRGKGIYFT